MLKQGLLVKVCRKTNKSRRFYLFTDMLLYAAASRSKSSVSPSSQKSPSHHASANGSTGASFVSAPSVSQTLHYRRHFSLDQIVIEDVPDSEFFKSCFQIRSPEKSFAVLCASDDEKHRWIAAIQQAIDHLRRSRSTLRLNDDEDPVGALPSHPIDGFQAPVWVHNCSFI